MGLKDDFDVKGEIDADNLSQSVSALGGLMSELKEVNAKLASKDFFDKDLSKSLGEQITKALKDISKLSQQTPVDLSPILKEISQQNRNILDILGKLQTPAGTDNSELLKSILASVAKGNELLADNVDYSKQFEAIREAIAQAKPEVTGQVQWQFTFKRSKMGNTLEEIIATPISKK